MKTTKLLPGNTTPAMLELYKLQLKSEKFFRHTFAKNLLVNEVPLETVSLLLGHQKIAITEKHYARFLPERQALIESQVRKTWARVGHASK